MSAVKLKRHFHAHRLVYVCCSCFFFFVTAGNARATGTDHGQDGGREIAAKGIAQETRRVDFRTGARQPTDASGSQREGSGTRDNQKRSRGSGSSDDTNCHSVTRVAARTNVEP